MPLNPNKVSDLSRLRRAMEFSRKRLEPFRVSHKQALEQYVGMYYSDDGSTKPVHVNLMELAASVYERNLSARPPQVTIFTQNDQHLAVGRKLEAVVNSQLKKFKIHRELQRCVKSALFSVGICKVGLETIKTYEEGGYRFADTQPFVKNILLDDWCHDMTSFSPEEFNYSGHRYRMLLDEAKADKSFSKAARDSLQKFEKTAYNETGDERVSTMTQGTAGYHDDAYDKVELWEVFLPKEQLLVTMTLEDGLEKPLRVLDWDGPQEGPFHMLWFSEVPGNSMPLAPAMLWQGLHNLVNGLYRKLERQAQRAKMIGLTRSAQSQDADRIRRASDGEIVAVDTPDSVVERAFGGIDKSNFAFMLQSKEIFSWLAGNLDSLGGLGPQSDTVGQDRLLFASANQRIAGMQDQVILFTKQILTHFAGYLWDDPVKSYPATIKTEGLPELRTQLSPDDRSTHSFHEHEMDVEPYSMQYQTPAQRLGSINQVLQTIVMPSLPLLQQQGMNVDFEAIMRIYAKYGNLPELNEIVKKEEVHSEPTGGQLDLRQAANTTRTNERVNISPNATQNEAQSMVNNILRESAEAPNMGEQ